MIANVGALIYEEWVPYKYQLTLTLQCFLAQNKQGILPVATLSIALYVFRRSRPASDVSPEVAILLSAL